MSLSLCLDCGSRWDGYGCISILMKIEALHLHMRVRHPQYGVGTVQKIQSHAAEIQFEEGLKTIAPETSGLEPAEPQASISGLEVPLDQLIDQTTQAILKSLGFDKPDTVVEELGARWHRGRITLHPSDPSLQSKEVSLETFFHKIVMMRNNLRVLEQKINSNPQLTDADKVELQQYVSRCHGSMTTFNILFKNKHDQFGS